MKSGCRIFFDILRFWKEFNATLLEACFDNETYRQCLTFSELESLKHRRIVRDLIMTFKIIRGYVDLNSDLFFEFAPNLGTRGQTS